jgi:hypothetical protein
VLVVDLHTHRWVIEIFAVWGIFELAATALAADRSLQRRKQSRQRARSVDSDPAG